MALSKQAELAKKRRPRLSSTAADDHTPEQPTPVRSNAQPGRVARKPRGSPNSLSRNGWRPSTFAPGKSVSIKVNPMKDGSTGGQFIGAKFTDGTTIGNWEKAGD